MSPIHAVTTSRAGRGWAALLGSAIALFASLATASEPWANVRPRSQDMLGTLSCMSASCHGGTGPREEIGQWPRHQYVHWLGSDARYQEGRRAYDPRALLGRDDSDPHALAGQRISQPRFQEVLRQASRRPDGSVDPRTYDRCAQCHDPLGMMVSGYVSGAEAIPIPMGERGRPSSRPGEGLQLRAATGVQTPALTQREREQSRGQGISCESCHGGARQWISRHYQRDITREQLTQLGMIDTKNLLVRARQCASCHVGSADQDMNHDIIAAGHPPLRFELASYEALLARKHWDDQPQRITNPNYEVQLWAAGRVAAAEATLELLKGRAQRAADIQANPRNATEDVPNSAGPWPEFAESNCFACHQPLRSMAGKLPLDAQRRPGMAEWQSWNTALATAVVGRRSRADNELPPESFLTALDRLRATMQRSFEPPPAEILALTAAARAALRQAVSMAPDGQVLDREGRPLDTRAVLTWLPAAAGSWDEASQQIAALVAVERARWDAGQQREASASVELHERIRRAAHSLRFVSRDRQWPAALADATAGSRSLPAAMSLTEISNELDAIRRELLTMTNNELTGLQP